MQRLSTLGAAFFHGLPKTPRSKPAIVVYAVVVWLLAPVDVFIAYNLALDAGRFPVDADSIGIPILMTWFMSCVATPLFIAFLWFALRRYRSTSWLVWDGTRPVRSFVWTGLCAFAAVYYLHPELELIYLFDISCLYCDPFDYPLYMIHRVGMAILFLLLRAAIVAHNQPRDERAKACPPGRGL